MSQLRTAVAPAEDVVLLVVRHLVRGAELQRDGRHRQHLEHVANSAVVRQQLNRPNAFRRREKKREEEKFSLLMVVLPSGFIPSAPTCILDVSILVESNWRPCIRVEECDILPVILAVRPSDVGEHLTRFIDGHLDPKRLRQASVIQRNLQANKTECQQTTG